MLSNRKANPSKFRAIKLTVIRLLKLVTSFLVYVCRVFFQAWSILIIDRLAPENLETLLTQMQ